MADVVVEKRDRATSRAAVVWVSSVWSVEIWEWRRESWGEREGEAEGKVDGEGAAVIASAALFRDICREGWAVAVVSVAVSVSMSLFVAETGGAVILVVMVPVDGSEVVVVVGSTEVEQLGCSGADAEAGVEVGASVDADGGSS